ncbi:MAG: LysM peptidoglycan-binding domain-containing protein, partial [Chloroflexota bacterium]
MKKLFAALWLIGLLTLSACGPASPSVPSASTPTLPPTLESAEPTATATATRTPPPTATSVPPSPTPDSPRANTPDLSALGEGWAAFSYKLRPGDDLGKIAALYGVSYDQIRAANNFDGGETLYPGQVILVPQKIQQASPPLKLIPDSELVYGPSTIGFDTLAFVAKHKRGYLYNYAETVNGESVSGVALVQRAAESYSLNPRLLIALVEYQSGWLTQAEPSETIYPFGRAEGGTEGLYRQLQWTANALNRGFYGWRDGSLSLLILGDGARVGLSAGLNA